MAKEKGNRVLPELRKEYTDKSIYDMGWDELEIGAAVFSFREEIDQCPSSILPEDRDYEQTNSTYNYVGDWRVKKPVWNMDLCISCQHCWIFCPDAAIISRNKQILGIDYDHCKGCGICVEVCPTNPKSLLMFDENTPNDIALTQWPEKKSKGNNNE
jgi:pyruvate ferredoxin oxidoreductase delta subunit